MVPDICTEREARRGEGAEVRVLVHTVHCVLYCYIVSSPVLMYDKYQCSVA